MDNTFNFSCFSFYPFSEGLAIVKLWKYKIAKVIVPLKYDDAGNRFINGK